MTTTLAGNGRGPGLGDRQGDVGHALGGVFEDEDAIGDADLRRGEAHAATAARWRHLGDELLNLGAVDVRHGHLLGNLAEQGVPAWTISRWPLARLMRLPNALVGPSIHVPSGLDSPYAGGATARERRRCVTTRGTTGAARRREAPPAATWPVGTPHAADPIDMWAARMVWWGRAQGRVVPDGVAPPPPVRTSTSAAVGRTRFARSADSSKLGRGASRM